VKNQKFKPTVVIRPKKRLDEVIANFITEGKTNSAIQRMLPTVTLEQINKLRRKP